MNSTAIATGRGRSGAIRTPSPNVVLLAVVCILAVVLLMPLTLPLGAFYWDLVVYFDAANRIMDGQIPGVDFFTPVGPLGYYLATIFLELFPKAQPLILVSWSLLAVTAPLMAMVLGEVDRRSRAVAFALLAPFLVFQILPTNVEHYSSYPGFDGFGIYNRQVDQLLYVLTAGLVFCRSQKRLLALVTACLLALFLLKITGFAAALAICLFAFAAGRLSLSTAVAGSIGFFAALGALEVFTGVTSAYVGDILALVRLNEESLLPRFLQAASLHFGVLSAAGLLSLLLLAVDWSDFSSAARRLRKSFTPASVAALVDREAFWLAAVLAAGLFFETQNTGGQAFIFLWPVLLAILSRASRRDGGTLVAILSLVAAASLPTFVDVAHRSARGLVGQIGYQRLGDPELEALGAVSQRPEVMERADAMIEAYVRYPEHYQFLADQGQLPSFTLYTEPDFQVGWLKATAIGVRSIRSYETANDIRFDTIMSLNFVNPFPWLLGRHAPRHLAIGADPFRAVPLPDAATLDAVGRTDLVLYPKCPLTAANQRLLELYSQALTTHQRVALSPCWDGYIRPALLDGATPKQKILPARPSPNGKG